MGGAWRFEEEEVRKKKNEGREVSWKVKHKNEGSWRGFMKVYEAW